MSALFEPIRYKLVEQQIRPWNVSDSDILNTLLTLHRERFVPTNLAHLAFTDTQLPLPGATHPSQVMFEPKVEARILQALKPSSKETVLEVGAGSGYMAALLAQYAKFVTTVDSDSQMVNLSKTVDSIAERACASFPYCVINCSLNGREVEGENPRVSANECFGPNTRSY